MICNLDGSWTLEPKDIRGLNLAVGKILQERAESNIKSFNAEKFVKYMHDQILDKTNDAQKALAFARFVPEAMLTLSVTKPDIRRALTEKGFDMGQVTQLADRFSNSLNDVANFIAEQTPSSNTSNINGQIQTNTYISNLQPKPEDAKEPILANKGDVSDLPYSPLSTTGNELIEGREWYYGFIKKLGDIITKTGISSDGVVSYNGVETGDNNGGIRLAFVKGNSIPVNQLYPDNQNIAEIESIKENQYFAVITDSKGNYLYFTDNYEATNADQGKLVYFPVRTVPSFKVNERGIRVYNLEEQMDKSIQSIEDRIRKSPGVLTREQVIEEYSAAYDLITFFEYNWL
jgi:hypothetical protein